MSDSKTYHGITPTIFECVKESSEKEHDTKYDPADGNSGTATTKTAVGNVVMDFSYDPDSGDLSYTIAKKPFVAPASAIWHGIGSTIDGCRSKHYAAT